MSAVKAAHTKVLVQTKIGTIDEYKEAEQELYRVITSGGNPSQVLDPVTFRRGLFYQNLLKDNVGFDIQYVVGDYKIAENSFLKINKSERTAKLFRYRRRGRGTRYQVDRSPE